MSTPQLLKLPLRLIRDYDRTIITTFRESEKLHRSLAKFRNHLHFTLHCKHHGVFPTSLKIKTSMKGTTANNIINQAQRALMNERIKQINTHITCLEGKIQDLEERLSSSTLPDATLSEIKEWLNNTRRIEWDKVRQRHRKKFELLALKNNRRQQNDKSEITPVPEEIKRKTKERWVINLSDRQLTKPEQEVLEKGLNFAVAPNKLPVVDLITSIETACRYIGPNSEEATHLRSDCVRIMKQAKLPKSNLTPEQRRALADLKNEHATMILPADKGRATVIMPRPMYYEKASKLLEDTTTYERLKKDPTSKFSNKLKDTLKRLKETDRLSLEQYRKLYPTVSDVPKFYGLPKVHKKEVPLRPIVASRGSIMYETARFVADILSPLVGHTDHHIHNSADLVEKLSNYTLAHDELLVSYDVSALFTSVPVKESIEIIRRRLQNDQTLHQRTSLTVDDVCELLSCCLTTTYFTFQGEFYQQKEGAAMGSPVSPIVANLFMEDFEEKALASFQPPPRYWGRYVDDTMTILPQQLVEQFTEHLNNQHPAIKFTREVEQNNSIAMLDTLITRTDGILSFSVYRKPTHTDQYLQFDSHQPLEHKLGVIRTLTHRANTICSTQEAKDKETNHLKKVLTISGYKKWAWNSPGGRKSNTASQQPVKQHQRKGHITIPYVGGVSDALSRKIRKLGVAVHSKPSNTIRSQLVTPKDKTSKLDKAGIIYRIDCQDCNQHYVGETERPLQKRLTEHKKDSSPVGAHLHAEQHQFSADNVNILDRENKWFQRGVKEAIYIAATNPPLNRDRGRYTLPPVYHSLIRSRELGSSHVREI